MNAVKEIRNVRFASGVALEYGLEVQEQPELKQYEENAFFLKTNNSNPEDKEFIEISLDDLYIDMKKAVHDYKEDETSLNSSILRLANQYGLLRYKHSHYLSDEEHSFRDQFERLRIKSSYNFNGFYEYYIWESLITKFFPVNLPYLKTWVHSKNISYDLLFLNHYLQDVKVGFTSLKMNKYEVIPNNLVSAIILFIKAKKHKKDPFVTCGYEPCKKVFDNNIGKGQPKSYCSNSHRTMAYRLRQRELKNSS